MSDWNCGVLMFFGQFIDAIATPIIGKWQKKKLINEGFQSDKMRDIKYGKKKLMHLVGSISVLISFPFLFNAVPGLPLDDPKQKNMKFIYYMFMAMVFQFGWAAVQLSHMALIPTLTMDDKERVNLNTIRCSLLYLVNFK